MAKVQKKSKTLGKGGIIAIVVSITIIVVLLAVVIVLLLQKNVKIEEKEEIPKRNVVVTEANAENIVDTMLQQEYVAPGYYSTSMSTTWHFATGDAVSEDAYVKNKETNTNDVYFDVFLVGDETTSILQSPVIPRGGSLESIALDTPLDAGTYDCVMVYHLIDDDQNTLSTLRIAFTIIVEQ